MADHQETIAFGDKPLKARYKIRMSNHLKKAPFNDWWYWSDILSKRLKTIADIYRENDERLRADDMAATSKKLYELFMGPARKGQKGVKDPAAKAELVKEEEAAIAEGVNIWRDILATLPFVSEAMEAYLAVKWREIDPEAKKKDEDKGGKSSSGTTGGAKPKKIEPRAIELFWGANGRYDEGIRSGNPKDGGLPGILMNYIQGEKSNSSRNPSEYKNESQHQNYWGRDQKNAMKPPGMGGM